MQNIDTQDAFQQALSSLSLAQQRQVGARFIAHVLDLTDGSCVQHATAVAEKGDISPEELESAYRAVHAVYVATSPDSGLSPLDFNKQAAHFVAEACMVCLAPTFAGRSAQHLAEKVASYCRMARTCANIQHEAKYPNLSKAQAPLKDEIDAQHEILAEFISKT